MKITSLGQAVDFARETLKAHPQRDGQTVRQAALHGQRRRHSGLCLGLHTRPDDTTAAPSVFLPPQVEMPDGVEAKLARELVAKFAPLDMLNSVGTNFGSGAGTGTLVTLFGVPLDPQLQNAPAYTLSIDDVLSQGLPDIPNAGLMPRIRGKINAVKDHLPEDFLVSGPDMQGPFNIAHQLTGTEALISPLTDPDKFRRLMDLVTNVWLDAHQIIADWIGPGRALPEPPRIAECSVNLVSRQVYDEFILPCDLRVRGALGPIGIHTCSGPHVFAATIEGIPDVVYTEAGYIEAAVQAAGYTPVEMALEAIGDRPIMLNIGEELHDGDLFEQVRRRLDLYAGNPRLLYAFTVMNGRKEDAPRVRELHQRLDDYWDSRSPGAAG